MNKPVRTRFAPSPTGLLHIGGVRTALFNYLYSKKHNGVFVLRLEDTDRERFVEEGVEQIIKSLDWVGLHPDEGVWYEEKPGKHGPYIQSKRLNHYTKFAQKLIEEGKAYYSHITPEAFAGLRDEAINAKKPFVYKQTMEPTSHNESKEQLPIRFKVPDGNTKWHDEARGEFDSSNELIDDFIIVKADGFPTYNFANVIDDHLMQISHVIRGDEFIGSTAKHILLYEALEFEKPKWVHLPSILGPEGKKKLSKRDGDVEVLNYRGMGYLPEVLINFLALLGWNDGGEQEIFSLEELVDKFSLERVQKSPAIFDIARLDWMNGEYIRKMPPEELIEALRAYIPKEWYVDSSYLKNVLMLDRERLKTLADARHMMEIFFETPKVDKGMLTKKDSLEEIKKWVQETIIALEGIEFSHDDLDKALRTLADSLNIKSGQLFYALRIALTGRTEAPGLFDIMIVLGKKETIERLENIN